MSAERVELSTYGLKGRCSAIELRARSAARRRLANKAVCILTCESNTGKTRGVQAVGGEHD